jgi:hypothetical protein
MNTKARLRIEMAIRVRNLLEANPFEEPNAVQVVTQFGAKVGRAQDLVAQRESGIASARAARAKRSELRRQLRDEPLKQLTEIAKAAARDRPELANLFRGVRADVNQQEFRARVQGVLERVAESKELFLELGMRSTLVDELTQALAAYDAAIAEADAGRRAHVGARVELDALSKELVLMVGHLDGMMVYRLRAEPDLAGAWRSARNVAWPARRAPERPAPGSPTGIDAEKPAA